jgi:hypothetical protein
MQTMEQYTQYAKQVLTWVLMQIKHVENSCGVLT